MRVLSMLLLVVALLSMVCYFRVLFLVPLFYSWRVVVVCRRWCQEFSNQGPDRKFLGYVVFSKVLELSH